MADNKQEIRVEMRKELIGGVYANTLRISHTSEEFIMDFIMIAPPAGDVTARVITSPGHMKRILAAMQENIQRYEKKYGKIKPSVEPEHDHKIGFKP
jgi:hypothetical protein